MIQSVWILRHHGNVVDVIKQWQYDTYLWTLAYGIYVRTPSLSGQICGSFWFYVFCFIVAFFSFSLFSGSFIQSICYGNGKPISIHLSCLLKMLSKNK